MCLNAWFIEVAYEEVWPCWKKYVTVEAGFEVSDVQARPSVAFTSAVCRLSCGTLRPCLPACWHIFCHDNNGLNL